LNEEGGEEEGGLTTTIPNSFSLPSTPGLFFFSLKKSFLWFILIGDNKRSSQPTNSPIQLLKSLQKIVPRNILDVLQTGVNESTKLQSDNDIKGLINRRKKNLQYKLNFI